MKTGDSYDRDVVLRALVAAVRREREGGRAPDVVFATGDVAASGKAAEYEIASRFFDDLLAAAGLGRERLFVIAGNHDVDREAGVGLSRTLGSREEADAYFDPDRELLHLAYKQRAFLDWYAAYFEGIRPRAASSCGTVEMFEVGGVRLGVLGINSALFCQDDHDHAKLWVGRRALDVPARTLRDAEVDLRIVLVHHPLEWLADAERANIRSILAESADVVLRGHLHETDVTQVVMPQGELVHIAAGAAYQTRGWPNRALYVTVTGEWLEVFPIRYEDSPSEIWTTDTSVYPTATDAGYVGRIPLRRRHVDGSAPGSATETLDADAAPVASVVRRASALFPSNIASRRGLRVVGRETELDMLHAELSGGAGDRVVVVAGPPGVGKSELAREYARRQSARYPGGTFAVDATGAGVLVDLTRIAATYLGVRLPDGLTVEEQCTYALAAVGSEASLVIYDNVESFDAIERWLPPAGMPCHVIITSIPGPHTPGWTVIQVDPLSEDSSLDLVAELAGQDVADEYGAALVRHCAGLPVELCPLAAVLGDDHRRGRDHGVDLNQPSLQARQSFGVVYERLSAPAQVLLHSAAGLNPQRISATQLHAELQDALEWSQRDTADAIDECVELQLLRGTPDAELTMHQLLGRYLIQSRPGPDAVVGRELATVRAHQRDQFVAAARALSGNPADLAHAAELTSFELTPATWLIPERPLSSGDLHIIGDALSQIGQFTQARPFCEQAVEARQADVRGDIDHESLSSSLHLVGYCYLQMGEHKQARPLFEQAVEEARQGDVRGRVDHESIGRSIHAVGVCYSETGEHEQARPFFEQAVKEGRRGDVQGRVDHASLSVSLQQAGYCYSQMGGYEQARPFLEQAVKEGRRGDVQGRVDHESLSVSLHLAGYCHSQLGEYAQARPFYEQAVEEAREGDVHGRVDHESIGRSLHLVGYCYSQVGEHERARRFFEDAVHEKRPGDVYGRIDHDSLGRSLHEVGACYAQMGEHQQARPFFEQAVEAKRQGDLHGRVDNASVRLTYRAGAECLRALGDDDGARDWEHEANSLNRTGGEGE